tara:strand:- start:938 stop:1375 length:438 start_codon:yes stop_codon:yes gene_type:complete
MGKKCCYSANDKQKTLINLGLNASKFPTTNHLMVSTSDTNEFKSGPGYEKLLMKTLISDTNGYRSFCKIKKGNIEHPHFHYGRYELFVISGLLKYTNEETKEDFFLKKGDYYCNPPLLKHSSICLEDAEIFWMYDRIPDCNRINK